MLLNAGKKQYRIIREVFTGNTNDVYVCQNQDDAKSAYKTIWIVKKREIAKALLGSFEKTDASLLEECFAQNENMCFVLPYSQERPLYKFYISNIKNQSRSRQQIWLDLVVKCMTGRLPDALLNLILRQEQIQLEPDGSIGFSFFLDLSEYTASVTEKENVILCAEKIVELIRLENEDSKEAAVLLLEKKLDRKKYQEFIQLYKDIKLIMQDDSDTDLKIYIKIKNMILAKQDRIYMVLSYICILLISIIIINLLGHLFLGEFSFWKLFGNSLEQIGTESLLK